MNPYRSNQWKAFREQIIELDGRVCVRCGRNASAEVILHVHHKHYVAGRKPWEYPYNQCETLCSGCHAAEHGKIRPPFGWEHIGYEDLGDVIGDSMSLVAPASVLQALHNFQGEISCRNTRRSPEEHDRLLNILIRAIRADMRPREERYVGDFEFRLITTPPTA